MPYSWPALRVLSVRSMALLYTTYYAYVRTRHVFVLPGCLSVLFPYSYGLGIRRGRPDFKLMRVNRKSLRSAEALGQIMAQLQVPKEYVRRQLQSMGIQEISEGDLESYTRGETLSLEYFPSVPLATCYHGHPCLLADFSMLIQEQLHREDSAQPSSNNSSLGGTPHSLPTSGAFSQAAHFHSGVFNPTMEGKLIV